MDLSKTLCEKCILLNAECSDKEAILRKIAGLATQHPAIPAAKEDEIYAGLQAREALGSTGFGNGIAIPHCALEDLTDFAMGILTVPDGVDFEAIDGKKTRLYVFIIVPKSKRNLHIRLLSRVSNALRSSNNVRELLAAKDAAILRELFLRQTHVEIEPQKAKEHNLFQVVVQREELFQDILNIFAEVEGCSISVIDGNDASTYLYTQPLFSSFWSDKQKGFNRIIVAVVNKSISNEIIRKLNMILEDQEKPPGIAMIVQDVFYANGSLNI